MTGHFMQLADEVIQLTNIKLSHLNLKNSQSFYFSDTHKHTNVYECQINVK